MITRYRPDVDEMERSAPMHEDKEGDYVAYEDYEDEVNALKSEIARLKNARHLNEGGDEQLCYRTGTLV